MRLDNLVKTQQLEPYTAQPAEVQRLFAAARRNLADAQFDEISDETRFDAAYEAIIQCAMAGLMANGYRPSRSTPGHHQTMIQTLPTTLGVPRENWRVMDALRRKRNVNDYSGTLIGPEAMRECIRQATTLIETTLQWLRANKLEMLPGQVGTDPGRRRRATT